MQPLSNLLQQLIKDTGIESATALLTIQKKWTDIVGQAVAVHTCPDTIQKKVLTIIVDTPQWMHHLSFFKKEISEKLAPYGITSIRFRTGRLPEQTQQEERIVYAPLSDEDARFIENTLKTVKDEDVKEKFRTLITKGLTRGRQNK